jgi:hypothetical protein
MVNHWEPVTKKRRIQVENKELKATKEKVKEKENIGKKNTRKSMRRPGIEPGPSAWKADILPLD